jgi:small subunit ribosomal protein S19
MAKELTYRGKTPAELKQLDVRSFAKLVPSRERRTLLRQFQEIEQFVARCNNKITKKKQIKTHQRTIIIVPQMVDMTIQVHTGKE